MFVYGMKRKLNLFIISLIFVLLITAYFTMTPLGALRLAIILSGHPVSAFTFEVMDEPYYTYTDENFIGYSLINPPYEIPTQSELVNWIVTKRGFFYTADYFGWG